MLVVVYDGERITDAQSDADDSSVVAIRFQARWPWSPDGATKDESRMRSAYPWLAQAADINGFGSPYRRGDANDRLVHCDRSE